MSIYAKLNAARKTFHAIKLEKTGLNKFAGYKYFELGDFLIPALKVLDENGLCAVVSFSADIASMTIAETAGDGVLTITSPMGSAALKGCHEVQNIGAVETYQRRYLWVAALEIVEHDALDSSAGPVEKGRPVIKHSPTGGILETLDPKRQSILVDCADGMRTMWASDDLMGAYEIACQITDSEEKTALWDLLKTDSKLRAAIKAHAQSINTQKAQ